MGQLLSDIERCPHCSIATPLLALKYSGAVDIGTPDKLRLWAAYECSSCKSLVTAQGSVPKSWSSNIQAHHYQTPPVAEYICPLPAGVDDDLPERPRRYLTQAINALHAPDGAVMLAGSAVDAMLKLKGYIDGSLYQRIGEAVKKGDLTENMSQWAHAVRLESNKPRHADLEESHASPEIAVQTIEFAKALGQFLFVLPAKIERGRKTSEAAVAASVSAIVVPSDTAL